MNTVIPAHSITILVGPTGCGKSTLAAKLAEQGAIVLSSDQYRYWFSGIPENSNDPGKEEVSAQAFNVLFAELEAMTSFPISFPHIVVDTTGLAEAFRNKVKEVALKNHYHFCAIVFDFKTRADYYTYSVHRKKEVVDRHVDVLRRSTLPRLRAKDYAVLYRHRKVDELPEITLEQAMAFQIDNAFVIGDIHECVEEFEELYRMAPEGSQVVLLGDYLDKGGRTKDMIEALYAKENLIICQANHENYVANRIQGNIKPNLELEAANFQSVEVLLQDEELAGKFLDLWEASVPFVRIKAEGQRTLYATHAPAEPKYLGKHDRLSLKQQRNLRMNRETNVFKYPVRPFNFPLQVCGHISRSPGMKPLLGGIYYIDTGCVQGHSLTALHYSSEGIKLVAVKSTRPQNGELFEFVADLPPKELVVEDPKDRRFLKRLPETGVRFISATMAPARSTNTDIENLEEAIKAFGGVEVELQPKYMGSRAQVYLSDDPEKDFCVSRNGFVVRDRPGLKEAFVKLRADLAALNFTWNKLVVLDCELLPWSVLGEGLITSNFLRYEAGIGMELGFLYELGKGNKELEDHFAAFSAQLKLYSTMSDPYFKPFGVLEKDGVLLAHHANFSLVNRDLTLRVKEYGPNVQAFFDHHVEINHMEGIVVKPVLWTEGLPPFLKVRNKEYLRLVYGYDYLLPAKYEALCRNKRVGGKINLSIKEHSLGLAMLASKDSDELVRNAFEMLATIKKEAQLDPRL